jgi:hypothetical protein
MEELLLVSLHYPLSMTKNKTTAATLLLWLAS